MEKSYNSDTEIQVERDQLESENSFASSDSETDGDELVDEEYDDIRKKIKPILNLGQTFTALWPLTLIEHADDIEDNISEFSEGQGLSQSVDWPSGSIRESFFETKHRRAPSLPSQVQLNQIKLELDEIHLTPDEEYGFNHQRLRARRSSGRRSISLYASKEELESLVHLQSPKKLDTVVLTHPALQDVKSHARNAEEAKIEEDIASLRAQPSNVEFNRKNQAKRRFQELVRGRSSKKRKESARTLRRQLSFDSHPRRRAFSDITQPTNRKSDNELNKTVLHVPIDVTDSQDSLVHAQVVDLSHYGSEPGLTHNCGDIKLAPPPGLDEKKMIEVLVSNPPEKEKKRKSNIPQFLTALRLPNKKAIKKLMRRKHERRHVPIVPKIPTPFPVEKLPVDVDRRSISAEEQDNDVPYLLKSPSVNTFARSSKTDGPSDRKQRNKRFFSTSGSTKRNSCSTCSLPRVEEGKETSEFGTLTRKSCSTCSIVVAKFLGGTKDTTAPLERRMSDTALTWNGERQPSCSPGKRFILKLLSPVVCGLSNDRYMNLHSSESYSSLTSCSSDVSAEADLLSQKLTDFNVQDVAEELALIDKELLIRITWQEMATCGWMSINKFVTSPNVMNMVEFFNRVAMMVASSILAEETIYLRAKAISKMIKLAAKCRLLKNYNSLRAVLGGLQCTPIYRLEASWKQVRARRKRLFSELSNLMSETENFVTYRAELSRNLKDPPCLPFLGDFLTQIAQTQAYLAMKRKRSLAKQRLEKSSITSSTEQSVATKSDVFGSSRPTSSAAGDEAKVIVEAAPDKNCREEDKSPVVEAKDNIENNRREKYKISENQEKNLDLIHQETENNDKNLQDCVLNTGLDETDSKVDVRNSDSNLERKEVSLGENERCLSPNLFAYNVKNLEDSTDLTDLHNKVIECSRSKSEVRLSRKERESIRKSISGVTAAMFQQGSKYQNSENNEELLEALNEYLDNPEVGDLPVFADIEASKDESTPDDVGSRSKFAYSDADDTRTCTCGRNEEEQSRDETGAIRIHGGSRKSDLPGVCVCCDHGVGSSSSYDMSPTTCPPDNSSFLESKEDDDDKRTHNRCDSNDSGVVLHNGRSSRASEELNGSQENLNNVGSDGHENSGFEDSKLGRDIDIIMEDSVDTADEKCCKTIPILERAESQTRQLEERIRRAKPQDEEAKYKKEFQFWEYQIAAMKYQITSKPILRKYLLSACYNSEEENYSLSLKREPIIKKL